MSPRFTPPDPVWRLENRPRELVEALEEHGELLMQQLGAEVVRTSLNGGQDSVAGQLLANCVDFANIASRLAAYVPQTMSNFSILVDDAESFSGFFCLQLAKEL